MKVIEYIGKKSGHQKEESQINRIIKIIIEWAKEKKLLNIWFFENVNYYHEGLKFEWNKEDWNGEIDLLFIAKNHFVIFELKNKKGIVRGQTYRGNWKIKYYDSDTFVEEGDYFIQCSKMKYYFSSNYWPNKIQKKINIENKLRPDVLLTFLDGSNLSNIFYCPPTKFHCDDYNNILEKLNNDDRNFMEKNFHYEKIENIIKINKESIDMYRLKKILISVGYEERVSKWFHSITEKEIKNLLPSLGSNSFEINENIIDLMIKDFDLKIIKEYCV